MKTLAIWPALVAVSSFSFVSPANAAAPPQPKTNPRPAEPEENNAAVAAAGRQALLSQPDAPLISDKKLPGNVRAATKDLENQSAHALDGRKVRGSDSKTLGTIKDFLVDAASGDASYAVISSEHGKLRLMPFRALKNDPSHAGDFSAPITEAAWLALGSIDEAEFKSGYVTVSDGERRNLAQRFGAEAGDATAFYTQAISAHLIRADLLRGRNVFVAGNKEIGTIKEIILSEESPSASAILAPSWQLTSARAKFVVPLNRFSFGTSKDERVLSILTRDDFNAMRAITHQAGAAGPPAQPSPAPPAASPANTPR